MIIAHKDPSTGQKQSLAEHLLNVAKFSSEYGSVIKQGDILFLIGLLHDLGKADRNFQKKINKKPTMRVTHSSAGAKYLMQKAHSSDLSGISKKVGFGEFIEVVLYVITAHHGLYDILKLESKDNQLVQRLRYDEINSGEIEYYFEEDVVPFAEKLFKENDIDLAELMIKAFNEFKDLSQRLNFDRGNKDEEKFYTSLKVRLYLSFLKNADITDSINAYEAVVEPLSNEEISNKKKDYIEKIEERYKEYESPENDMDAIRNRLASEAKERGEIDFPGVYQLNLPTGAGKTLLSLRYGVHQLNSQNKKRLFYITPFLSVLEQNADEIKTLLKDEDITEHHSNIVKELSPDKAEEDSKKEVFSQYLVDSWDSPVVLSTMVQFFQTLFKEKSNNIRRFSSLANSVIILDEVQSLPIEVTHLFNMTMNFISQTMQSSVVLCTATQPKYDSKYIKYPIDYSKDNGKGIVSMSNEERKIFDRTEIFKLNNGEESGAEEIVKEIISNPEDSVLIILNTKKAVNEVFDELKNQTDRPLFYLSTNLCPKHRKDVIEKIKELLPDEPVICVSTQLIEAGVDISFKRLIRSYAGIDSIVQAMGRCNRNGELPGKGIVKLVKTKKEFENINVSALKSIKDKVNETEKILRDEPEPLDLSKVNDDFFDSYYGNHSNKMNYPLGKDRGDAVSLLSSNQHRIVPGVNGRLKQSFRTAAENIDLIKQETTGVIVYYDEKSNEKIEKLIEAANQFELHYEIEQGAKIKMLLKELQPYTVNMYNLNEYSDEIMPYMDGRIKILQADYYDKQTGAVDKIDSLIM
ncbi:CRISPR-associated helicase Cas3' [Corticicoccus populi]|uniref:CRISPR-associated helicase Cas3 n=1 Tax=Corticicoccus populi TaxID=1812821 RepID=A0ABW5WT75_9STAP